jgi:hypothetical protein
LRSLGPVVHYLHRRGIAAGFSALMLIESDHRDYRGGDILIERAVMHWLDMEPET